MPKIFGDYRPQISYMYVFFIFHYQWTNHLIFGRSIVGATPTILQEFCCYAQNNTRKYLITS